MKQITYNLNIKSIDNDNDINFKKKKEYKDCNTYENINDEKYKDYYENFYS